MAKQYTKIDYLVALDNANIDPNSRKIIENLIDNHLSMAEHMKETRLWDIFEYEKRLTQPFEIIAYDNVKLKKEVNDLRKQLGMVKKYKTEEGEGLWD
jgi:hypothetical protein